MKTRLVVEMVKSHFKGEKSFYDSVYALIEDEEQKGNVGIATEIRDAFVSASIKSNKANSNFQKDN